MYEFDLSQPQSRGEEFLATLTGDYSGDLPEPQSRGEVYLKKLVDESGPTGDLAKRVSGLEDGKADLVDGKVPSVQLPSYVGDIDAVPTDGSENPVSSDGVYDELQNLKAMGFSVDSEGYLVQEADD